MFTVVASATGTSRSTGIPTEEPTATQRVSAEPLDPSDESPLPGGVTGGVVPVGSTVTVVVTVSLVPSG